MALTAKQEMFVKEYLIDLNATQAAIRAGYSEKTADVIANQLLSKTLVSAAIQDAMDKRSQRVEITADYVLTTIKNTIERCSQAHPVTYKDGTRVMVETPDGEIAPAYSFESGSVLKGCELLGKHLKLFTDKTEVSGPNGTPIELSINFVKPE